MIHRLNRRQEVSTLTAVALDQPLSESELEELESFLDSDLVPEETMNLCMLNGYLTAIAVGPVTLLPSEWFPRIWGEGDEPAFDSLEHAQRIFDLITRFYNHIVRKFMKAPEEFQPFLYEDVQDGQPTLSAEEWCIGFSLGIHLRSEAWEPLLKDEENSGILAAIVAFSLDDAWEEVTEGRDPVEVRDELIGLLPATVFAIHAYWQPLRQKRAAGLTPDSVRLGGSSKSGRNAPCPCGSGKKFKNCCGVAGKN